MSSWREKAGAMVAIKGSDFFNALTTLVQFSDHLKRSSESGEGRVTVPAMCHRLYSPKYLSHRLIAIFHSFPSQLSEV